MVFDFCGAYRIATKRNSGCLMHKIVLAASIAFAFSLFTIYGCGPEAVLYGLTLLLLGLPVYVWQRRQAREEEPC